MILAIASELKKLGRAYSEQLQVWPNNLSIDPIVVLG